MPKTMKAADNRENEPPVSINLEPLNDYVCKKIRQLRRDRNWTLEQLASASGVSRSMLSQVERGRANPTLAVAFRIAQAFKITLGDLVAGASSTSRIDVIRAQDQTNIFRDDANCRIRTLSPLDLEKDVEFYEILLHDRGSLTSAAHFDGTREFLTVQKGAVRVDCGGESVTIRRGDSAQYAADIEHSITNIGNGPAVLFLVVTYATHR